MYNKILVPLDGSSLAECSLEHVKALATGCKVAEVVLLTVTQEVLATELPGSIQNADQIGEKTVKTREMVREKTKEYLDGVSKGLKSSGLTTQTEIVEAFGTQHPADVILDYAETNKVDLIVISTHGRSGISRWAFGSEADKMVRGSRIPVLSITPSGCRVWPSSRPVS